MPSKEMRKQDQHLSSPQDMSGNIRILHKSTTHEESLEPRVVRKSSYQKLIENLKIASQIDSQSYLKNA